jgi:peptide-methionine (S)-S-oxide reductase
MAALGLMAMTGCGQNQTIPTGQPVTHAPRAAGSTDTLPSATAPTERTDMDNSESATATFGAGCFWCVEAIFQRVDGVNKVVSGYTGGSVPNPTYKQICTGTTGHAEVIQLTFQPATVSFAQLVAIFFDTHDPTTLNQQGNDRGTQYRSAIFYHDDDQKATADRIIAELTAGKVFDDPIVTEVTAAPTFYPAEDYHQNYFNLNRQQQYCQFIIEPKVKKFLAKQRTKAD